MKLTSKHIKKAIQKYIKESHDLKYIIYKHIEEGRTTRKTEKYRNPNCARRQYCILGEDCGCGYRDIPGSDYIIYKDFQAYLDKKENYGNTLSDITRLKRYKEGDTIVRTYSVTLPGIIKLYEHPDGTLQAEWEFTEYGDLTPKHTVPLNWDITNTIKQLS